MRKRSKNRQAFPHSHILLGILQNISRLHDCNYSLEDALNAF